MDSRRDSTESTERVSYPSLQAITSTANSNTTPIAPAPTTQQAPALEEIVRLYEQAQNNDKEKAIRIREDNKKFTAAQIYATANEQQKNDLFLHYMQKLNATVQRLKNDNTPYANLAEKMQQQIDAAYHDTTFADSHIPTKQGLVNFTQNLIKLLDTPHLIEGRLNPELAEQVSSMEKLAGSLRYNARLETVLGVFNLLLATIVAAACVALSIFTIGSLTLPSVACVIGLYSLSGVVNGGLFALGVGTSAGLFHDARRQSNLANALQPLTGALRDSMPAQRL